MTSNIILLVSVLMFFRSNLCDDGVGIDSDCANSSMYHTLSYEVYMKHGETVVRVSLAESKVLL